MDIITKKEKSSRNYLRLKIPLFTWCTRGTSEAKMNNMILFCTYPGKLVNSRATALLTSRVGTGLATAAESSREKEKILHKDNIKGEAAISNKFLRLLLVPILIVRLLLPHDFM